MNSTDAPAVVHYCIIYYWTDLFFPATLIGKRWWWMVRSKSPHGQRAVGWKHWTFPCGHCGLMRRSDDDLDTCDRGSEMCPAQSTCWPGCHHVHIDLCSFLPVPVCPSCSLGLPVLLQEAFPMSALLHALSAHSSKPIGLTTSECAHHPPPF